MLQVLLFMFINYVHTPVATLGPPPTGGLVVLNTCMIKHTSAKTIPYCVINPLINVCTPVIDAKYLA